MRKTSSSNYICKTYEYPVGNTPDDVNCLEDCKFKNFINYTKLLSRGNDHSKVGVTKKEINGLYDMGTNLCECASNREQKNQSHER